MRKRRANKSSLELFLDTICNVFGGIVLIAILLAILVRHTEGTIKIPEALSPEKIAEAQQELDQISAEIETLRVLFYTVSATLPKPLNPADIERADLYHKLSEAKGAAAVKKAELLHQHLALEKERIDWEDSTQNVRTQLQQAKNERQRLAEEVGKLNRQITENQRRENVYMPRLRSAASNKRPKTFVLHGNRLYVRDYRNHFDYILNESDGSQIVVPKKNEGILVEDTLISKNLIYSLFDLTIDSRIAYPSIQVYGDSADVWHIVRDIIVHANVEYELIPRTAYTRIPPPGDNRPQRITLCNCRTCASCLARETIDKPPGQSGTEDGRWDGTGIGPGTQGAGTGYRWVQ